MSRLVVCCLIAIGTAGIGPHCAVAAPGDLAGQSFDCVMDPSQTVKLSSQVTGLLQEVLVSRGDRVAKGQVVARLADDAEKAQVDLLAARAASTAQIEAQQAQLGLAQSHYDRQVELAARNISSQEQLNQAETELAAAVSLLAQAQLQRDLADKDLARAQVELAQREIVSPIDAIVTSRDMSAGEFLDQNSNVLTLVALDPLYVEAFLPVAFYTQVRPGLHATVLPEPPIGGRYDAVVAVVDQVFDAASATFGVLLELPNPAEALPGGQRCQLQFLPQ